MNGTVTLSTCAALTSPDHRLITVIGAGGKTSLLHWIAKSRLSAGQRVVITTTTKILPLHDVETVLSMDGSNFLDRLRTALRKDTCVIAAKSYNLKTGKLIGLDPETVDALYHSKIADTILVEADGAAHKPLKAPAAHEPVIPFESDICIGVMGLDAVHQPFSDRIVHRPELFSKITGAIIGEPITLHHLAEAVVSPDGMFKGCPEHCEQVVFLNKIDIPGGQRVIDEFRPVLAQTRDAAAFKWYSGSCRKQCLHRIEVPAVPHCAHYNRIEISPQF